MRRERIAGVSAALVLAALAGSKASGEDQVPDARLAEIFLEHGIPEVALSIAEHALAGTREGEKLKARALALQAKPERPSFLAAKDELDVAWELRASGKIGWAEALLDAALAGNAFGQADLAAARTIRARLHGDRSSMGASGDAKKRKESFEKAKDILAGIFDGPAAGALAACEAQCALYEIATSRGDRLLEAARRGDDAEAARSEAFQAFQDGETYLGSERKRLEAIANPTPSNERCLAKVLHLLPKCQIGHALSLQQNEREKRELLLRQAVAGLMDFNLAYSGQIDSYEAALDLVSACRELGDEAGAAAALASALDIEKTSPDFDPLGAPKAGPHKPLSLDDAPLDVFARASLAKARTLERHKPDEALAAIERVFADASAPPQSRKAYGDSFVGMTLRLERARIKIRKGGVHLLGAKADLQKIAGADPQGPLGERARELARAIDDKRDLDSAEIPFARAIKIARDALDGSAFHAALKHATLALEAARNERPDVAADDARAAALHAIGRAHRGLGRFSEAAVALEEVARRHARSPQGEDAALEWLACLERVAAVSPFSRDREAYESALRHVAATFKGTGEAVAAFFLGNKLREEGRFREAAEVYTKVGPQARTIHGEALYQGAVSRYLLVQRAKVAQADAKECLLAAAAGLRKALDFGAAGRPDETLRVELEARVRFLLAEVLLTEQVNEPRAVLALFLGPSRKESRDAVARAALFRILAHLRLHEADLAEAQLEALLADEGERSQKRTIIAARAVASALDDATNARADLPDEERRCIREKIGRYYAHGVFAGLEPGSDAVPSVRETRKAADRLFVLGLDVAGLATDTFAGDLEGRADLGKGRPLLEHAREMYALLAKPDERLGARRGPGSERILAGWGEAAGLTGDWATCRTVLERLTGETKLLDARGRIDGRVAGSHPLAVACYFDLGRARVEIGLEQRDDAAFDAGRRVFDDLLEVSQDCSPAWWRAKLASYRALERRGKAADWKELACAVRALARKYPGYEAAGTLAPSLVELEKRLKEKGF